MAAVHFNATFLDSGQSQVSLFLRKKSIQHPKGQGGEGIQQTHVFNPLSNSGAMSTLVCIQKKSQLEVKGTEPLPAGWSECLHLRQPLSVLYVPWLSKGPTAQHAGSLASTIKSHIFLQIFRREASFFFLHLKF